MKIEKITLCNLASIEGEQTIDFNAEPLRSAGLFAITGDTGAGKSTLLDAICLALYNKAPRFESRERMRRLDGNTPKKDIDLLPGDPRNILRRGTKEGYAEVTFTAQDNATYRARWELRVKRTGTYNHIERTLEQIRPAHRNFPPAEIDKAIGQLLGLDYTQFTRTVILAQNSFANFLRAEQDEKSSLLEKITGTEIYAQLGAEIYRLSKEAEKKHDEQAKKIEGINENRLSDVDLKRTEEERILCRTRLSHAEESLKHINACLKWYDDYERAEAEFRTRTEAHNKAQKALLAEGDKKRLLERYDLLIPLQPLYKEIKLTEQNIEQGREAQKRLGEILEKQRTEAKTAEKELEKAQARLAEEKQLSARRTPSIKKGYEIQGELKRAEEELQKKTDENRIASDRLAARQNAQRDKKKQYEASLECIEKGEHHQQTYAVHQRMLDKTDIITEKLSRMFDLTTDLKRLKQQLTRDQSDRTALTTVIERIKSESHDLTQKAASLREELQSHRQANYGRDGDEIQSRFMRLTSHTDRLQSAKALWERLAEIYRQTEETQAEISRRSTDLKHDQATLEKLSISVEARTEELERRSTAYTLSNSENIVRLRQQLKEGTACPVCGATHHPYHTETEQELGNLLSLLETEYNEARTQLEALKKEREDLTTKISASNATLQARKENLENLEKNRHTAEEEWGKYASLDPAFADCSPSTNRVGRRVMIDQLLDTVTKDLGDAQTRWNEYNTHQKEMNRYNDLIEKTQHALSEGNERMAEAERNLSITDTRIEQTQQRITHTNDILLQLYEELDDLITLQSWWTGWNDNPEAFRQKLMNMKADYDQGAQRLATERQNELILRQELATATTAVAEQQQIFLQTNDEKVRLSETLSDLQKQLSALFAGKTPQEAAEEMDKRIDEATTALNSARENFNRINTLLQHDMGRRLNLDENLNNLRTALSQLHSQMDDEILRFNHQYSPLQYSELDRIFSDTRDWNALRTLIAQLSEQVLVTSERAQTAQNAIVQLQASENRPNPDEESRPALNEAAAETGKTIENFREELNNLEYKLKMHAETIEKTRSLNEEMELLAQRKNDWAGLCALIGDSNGKNFRGQAQNFTFDFLVRDANEQLRRLSSRYRLNHLPGTLSLEVIDRDMFDQHRPVSSLSGGETFIVSLALALGLSTISASNLNIGSLFIDEGFGNLDGESLELVMTALSALQGTQGRKVGVISHTDQIRLRIRPQIHVVKQAAGGRSTIRIES